MGAPGPDPIRQPDATVPKTDVVVQETPQGRRRGSSALRGKSFEEGERALMPPRPGSAHREAFTGALSRWN